MKKLFVFTISLILFFAPFAEARRPVFNTFSKLGLVGYWSFNEGFGTAAYDYSGNRHNGQIGKALSFDGNNDYVNAGDIAAIDTATALTSCVWAYHQTITDDDAIIAKYVSDDGWVMLRDDVGSASGRTDEYTVYVADSADTDSARIEGATNSSPAKKWTFVCFTFQAGNASGLRLYINGVEDANSPVSTSAVGAINAGTAILSIGQYSDGVSSPFNGLIDDVRVYNRVLSAMEVKNMYRAGLTTH